MGSLAFRTALLSNAAPFNPASLFTSGAPGFLLDATLADLSSLFQDSSGTIPVTAVEQSVGLVLDDAQNAVGTNGAKRVNLLNWTEAFNNAAWVNAGTLTVSANDAIAPDGTTTADKFNVTAVTVDGDAGRYQFFNGIAVQYLLTYYVKPDTMTVVRCGMYDGSNFATRDFTFSTKSFGNARGTLSVGSTVYEELSNGWYRLSITVTSGMVSSSAFMAVYSASTGSGWFWGADLRLASEASTAPTPYQPITSSWPATMAGNHFVQSTSAARPVLSARVNLLTKTEEFNDAAWLKTNITVSANTTDTTDPLGGNTADRALETITNAAHFIDVSGAGLAVTNGVTYTRSVCLKFLGRQWVVLDMFDTVSRYTYFDIQNGVVGTNAAGTTASIQNLGNGWFRCSITRTVAASTLYIGTAIATSDGGSLTFVGDITKGYYIWGADLRVANDTTSPVYQRVNTATDYATTGFPIYLRYDGTDDFLVSAATVNFSTTAQMSVFAGVRRDAITSNYQTLYEHSASVDANNGTFGISGENIVAGGRLYASSKGTTVALAVPTAGTLNSISTNLLTHLMNISAPSVSLSSNSILVASSSSSQGTGNFGNHLFYIGRRAGTTTPLNGRIYFPLVVLGRTATATEIANMESFLNTRNGIY